MIGNDGKIKVVDPAVEKEKLLHPEDDVQEAIDVKRIDNIIASQMKKKEYLMNCDRVIDNSGDFAETIMQLDQIIKDL